MSKLDESQKELVDIFTTIQYLRALERHGAALDIGQRQQTRWESRMNRELTNVWPSVPRNVDAVVKAAERDWRLVEKGPAGDRTKRAIAHVLGSLNTFVRGAYAVYMDLAEDLSEDAGQNTLDMLGLNQTWKWTSPRDIARDLFSVRGSKIIQHAYGTHLEELQKMVIAATDPAAPKTQAQIRREIKENWSALSKAQVERIARTETATIWETTNFNVQKANGIETVEWLIAKGPSIGVKSHDVCKICLEKAANGPYPIGDIDPPPAHPNCRCTLIPSLEDDWIPPAETWNGVEPALPLVGATDPTS